MSIESYRDLDVWKVGMDLAVLAYQLTGNFPSEETFGLAAQIKRAAASVPANIAEGWGRGKTAEFRQFLRIAQGSLRELETHLLLAQRVGITTQAEVKPLLDLCTRLGKQLIQLQRSLASRQRS